MHVRHGMVGGQGILVVGANKAQVEWIYRMAEAEFRRKQRVDGVEPIVETPENPGRTGRFTRKDTRR